MSLHTHTRSRWTRPLRRLRRWSRRTPNGQIALSLMTLGSLFTVVALVLAVALLH